MSNSVSDSARQAVSPVPAVRSKSVFAGTVAAGLILTAIYDTLLHLRGFPTVRALVSKWKPRIRNSPRLSPDELIRACDLSFMAYVRTVKCVQRSAVLASVLRLNGYDAQIVVGVRSLPFFSHAWVEMDGKPLNENVELLRPLRVLDRF